MGWGWGWGNTPDTQVQLLHGHQVIFKCVILQLSSGKGDVSALGEVNMRSIPSVSSFPAGCDLCSTTRAIPLLFSIPQQQASIISIQTELEQESLCFPRQ